MVKDVPGGYCLPKDVMKVELFDSCGELTKKPYGRKKRNHIFSNRLSQCNCNVTTFCNQLINRKQCHCRWVKELMYSLATWLLMMMGCAATVMDCERGWPTPTVGWGFRDWTFEVCVNGILLTSGRPAAAVFTGVVLTLLWLFATKTRHTEKHKSFNNQKGPVNCSHKSSEYSQVQ